jgi:hypothetical protein
MKFTTKQIERANLLAGYCKQFPSIPASQVLPHSSLYQTAIFEHAPGQANGMVCGCSGCKYLYNIASTRFYSSVTSEKIQEMETQASEAIIAASPFSAAFQNDETALSGFESTSRSSHSRVLKESQLTHENSRTQTITRIKEHTLPDGTSVTKRDEMKETTQRTQSISEIEESIVTHKMLVSHQKQLVNSMYQGLTSEDIIDGVFGVFADARDAHHATILKFNATMIPMRTLLREDVRQAWEPVREPGSPADLPPLITLGLNAMITHCFTAGVYEAYEERSVAGAYAKMFSEEEEIIESLKDWIISGNVRVPPIGNRLVMQGLMVLNAFPSGLGPDRNSWIHYPIVLLPTLTSQRFPTRSLRRCWNAAKIRLTSLFGIETVRSYQRYRGMKHTLTLARVHSYELAEDEHIAQAFQFQYSALGGAKLHIETRSSPPCTNLIYEELVVRRKMVKQPLIFASEDVEVIGEEDGVDRRILCQKTQKLEYVIFMKTTEAGVVALNDFVRAYGYKADFDGKRNNPHLSNLEKYISVVEYDLAQRECLLRRQIPTPTAAFATALEEATMKHSKEVRAKFLRSCRGFWGLDRTTSKESGGKVEDFHDFMHQKFDTIPKRLWGTLPLNLRTRLIDINSEQKDQLMIEQNMLQTVPPVQSSVQPHALIVAPESHQVEPLTSMEINGTQNLLTSIEQLEACIDSHKFYSRMEETWKAIKKKITCNHEKPEEHVGPACSSQGMESMSDITM